VDDPNESIIDISCTLEYSVALTDVERTASNERDPRSSLETPTVNRGATRWSIVEHSRAAPTLEKQWANAVPHSTFRLFDEALSPPNWLRWHLHHVDTGGCDIVDGIIEIAWTCGTRSDDAFIRRMWADVSELSVASAFDLNLRAITGRPMRLTRSHFSVSCLSITLVGSVRGLAWSLPIEHHFEIRGDGSVSIGAHDAAHESAVAFAPSGAPSLDA
jgi:hypothetical protein